MFQKIKKRDGRIVKFDVDKIKNAIQKAGKVTGEFDEKMALKLGLKVLDVLIDGPFILVERDLSLSFRGSRNQRLLRLKNGEIASID